MAYSIVKPIGCYVYTHRKASNGDIFYVGKGTLERAWDKWGRNAFWRNIVSKHGLVVKIETQGLSDSDAHALERVTIAIFRAQGLRLANLTDGGEGTLNPTQETRAKIGAFHRGKPKSAEQRAKIRESNLGKRRSEEAIAKLRARVVSEDTRKKMSESGKSRAPASETTMKKLAESSRSRWLDEEYRLKVSTALTGKKRSAEFCKKMSEIIGNRPPTSTETRLKASEIQFAKWADPEYRASMKAVHAGKAWSAERRAAYDQGERARRSESQKAARGIK